MKNILPILSANLRGGKGQAINLLIFTLIAALLLNLGLLLTMAFDDFFDERSEALHAPHYALIEEKRLFTPEQEDYLRNHDGVTEVERETAVSFLTDISYNGGNMSARFTFLNADKTRAMNPLTLTDGKAPAGSDEICLPSLFKAGGGYQLGDDFSVEIAGKTFTFKICGFTEEILFGSLNGQAYQVYVSDSGYNAVLAQKPESECVVLRARLQDPADSEALLLDQAREFFVQADVSGADGGFVADGSSYVIAQDWNGAKLFRTMMSRITATVLVMFAAVIVLVSLLVVRFRIRNSIEESMTNIGALKAVGYTGRQLLGATVLQFFLIALVGVLAGIGLSYAILPTVSRILEMQTALVWKQGFDVTSSLISLVAILLATLAVTWLSAGRIRKLQPLTALRQGLITHNFKKNHFPLDRSRGPLSWLLALKSILQSKGQMVMIFIIVTAVSFAASAGLSLYDNMGVHPDMFAKLLGGEMPDAAFVADTPDNAVRVRDFIEETGDARKVFYYQNSDIMIDDIQVNNIVSDGFSQFEGTLLYEGRYPQHDNEICVSGILSENKGIKIGDVVTVKDTDYLTVGLIQTVNGNNGMASAMTIPGMRRIQPNYRTQEIYAYLNDNAKTVGFIDEVNAEFPGNFETVVNLDELMDAQLTVYGDIFFAVAIALVAITALVIFLVLYLMLKTVILRRRRELGIQKALGFTTAGLMNQLALYFIPVIALGVAAGGLLGIFGFNSIFVSLTRSMGIMTASMPAPIPLTIVTCVALVAVAYAFAMLIAARIRKISAYALVSE
ncbi:MAG: ABC transporter permease [Clostridiales Family XIII bacterium]|nr:ABC transporter permease [Clostridiales Family XIII bacterium]